LRAYDMIVYYVMSHSG